MASTHDYPTKLRYGLNVPVLFFDLVAMIMCTWLAVPSQQDRLSTDGIGAFFPALLAGALLTSFVHTAAGLFWPWYKQAHITRICFAIITVIPFLATMLSLELLWNVGMFSRGNCGMLGNGYGFGDGTYDWDRYDRDCLALYRLMYGVGWTAAVFSLISCVLTCVDLGYSFRARFRLVRRRKEQQFNELKPV